MSAQMSHNGTPAVSASSSSPIMSGYLYKRGSLNHAFQRRYFVLSSHYLEYYSTESAFASSPASSRGRLELVGCLCSLNRDLSLKEKFVSKDKKIPNENIFTLKVRTTKRVYIFCAPSEKEAEDWVDAIRKLEKNVSRVSVSDRFQREKSANEESAKSAADSSGALSSSHPNATNGKSADKSADISAPGSSQNSAAPSPRSSIHSTPNGGAAKFSSSICWNPVCHKPFSFVVRRHWCRRCQHMFCSNCSSKKLALFEMESVYGSTPQRVCDACYKELLAVKSPEEQQKAQLEQQQKMQQTLAPHQQPPTPGLPSQSDASLLSAAHGTEISQSSAVTSVASTQQLLDAHRSNDLPDYSKKAVGASLENGKAISAAVGFNLANGRGKAEFERLNDDNESDKDKKTSHTKNETDKKVNSNDKRDKERSSYAISAIDEDNKKAEHSKSVSRDHSSPINVTISTGPSANQLKPQSSLTSQPTPLSPSFPSDIRHQHEASTSKQVDLSARKQEKKKLQPLGVESDATAKDIGNKIEKNESSKMSKRSILCCC